MANSFFTLNKLSSDFYNTYTASNCPEIENKSDRPYMVMVVKIKGNIFALPFRTNIRHNYCYKFVNTNRQTDADTGIDFTKAVIVNNTNYIGDATTIDNREYVELSNKYHFIINKFISYLNGYIKWAKDGGSIYTDKKYRFCTLKYFHSELGI